MNRDDIIRMAREAGIPLDAQHPGWLLPHLERFAALVAAAEREACARIAEEYMPYGLNCAEEIRARGEVNGTMD
jgi:hypothetical protein